MKILVLSQVFYPDNVAVSLFMSDLSEQLVKNGHEVKVLAGQYNYENSSIKYPRTEIWRNVKIGRLPNTGIGKKSNLSRMIDFLSFNFLILVRLLRLNKKDYDLVISTTVPPMLSFFVSLIAKSKRMKFCYWAMDLQPELSISAGLVNPNSLGAKLLSRMGDRVFKKADHIFALDKYMLKHIIKRGGRPDKISISQLWPIMDKRDTASRLQNKFRMQHQWHDKLIIMYSGNHSLVHPLDTLLEAALQLRYRNDILFTFIGGGIRKADVTDFKIKNKLNNIVQLPFQPRENVHVSLSAADMQVVLMGNEQVGFTHPNKIYGALFLGKPILYVGPTPSHVTDQLQKIADNILVDHGESKLLANQITELANNPERLDKIGNRNLEFAKKHLNPDSLKENFVQKIESLFQI